LTDLAVGASALVASGGAADVSSLTTAISSVGLTKRFRGGQTAVHGLALAVPAGSVYGFLGPNGSGKTTSIRMLLGLIFASTGTFTLLDARKPGAGLDELSRIGTLVEGPAFHPYLSGRDNLARLDAADRRADPRTARTRIATALDRVGLSAAAGKSYRNYSLGMRQRLGIAAALLQPRDLLILDEPTNGLDPQGTREVRHLIQALGRDGVTVFVSSHLLAEVEQVCSHVGVMSTGRMVWQGALSELAAQQRARVRVLTSAPADAVLIFARAGLAEVTVEGDEVSAVLGAAVPEVLVHSLVTAGVPVRGFEVAAPRLEDVFVELTGAGFDVSG
jgi:ABC-type multidrug transport system ATPase subunit